MRSYSAGQNSLIAGVRKPSVKWLFEVDTDNDGVPEYYWATHGCTWGDQEYTAKVLDFDGITMSRSKSEAGLSAPSKFTLKISNKNSAISPADLAGAAVLVRLVIEGPDGELLGADQMSNGDMELYADYQDDGVTDIFTGWTNVGATGSNWIEATINKHGGANAVKILGDYQPYLYQDIDVSAYPTRTLMKLSMYARGNGSAAGQYSIYDVTHSAYITSITSTGITGTTYTEVSDYFFIPYGCASVRIALIGATSFGMVYFDDVTLCQVENELGSWMFQAMPRGSSVYQEISLDCRDWLQRYLQGDWPNTSLVQDLFPSDDPQKDNICVPVVWGTGYIAVRSAYVTDQRYYMLGPYSDTNFGAEKLTNGGFETSGGGGDDVFGTWSETKGSGTIADEGTIVHGGAHACKMTSGVSDDCHIDQDIAATPGKLHKLVMWARGDGTNAGRYYIYDVTNSAVITNTTSTGIIGTSYTKVEVWFTAPIGCVSVRIRLWSPVASGGICYYDDVSIKEVTDYTVTKVRSPREWGSKSEWTGTFMYYRKAGGDGVYYVMAQFIIADTDIDGTNDANGLFMQGERFLDVPCKYSYAATVSMTAPGNLIEYVLEDMGVPSAMIDDVSKAAVNSTFSGWSLTFNGGIWYRTNRKKFLAKLLTMCHCELLVRDKLYFKVHSKASQMMVDSGDVVRDGMGAGTFAVASVDINDQKDSGYAAYQEADKPIDSLVRVLVPAKATTAQISGETVECDYVQDGQDAQRIAILALQRILLAEKIVTFTGGGQTLKLEPDDAITVSGNNYDGAGSTYPALIDQMKIRRDLAVEYSCTRFGDTLDDWGDLSPGAVTVSADDSVNAYQPVISGPSSVGPTGGQVPNQVKGRLIVGDNSTSIVIDPDKGDDRVIYSGKTDFGTTDAGFIIGVDHSDGDKVKLYLGDASNYMYWDGTNLVISGQVTATSGAIGGWTIGATTLYNSTNIILDAGNKAVYINSSTYGNDGIQIEYNAGNPRIYIGDGSTKYFQFDGTDVKMSTGQILACALLNALTLGNGSTVSGTITLSIADTHGDCYIAAGKSDFTNTDNGFILGIDDSDSNKVKLYIGDSTNYLNWDGTNLTINVASADAIIVGSGGDIKLVSDAADPGVMKFVGTSYTTEFGSWAADGSLVKIDPQTDNVVEIYIGASPHWFKNIGLAAKQNIYLGVEYDGNHSILVTHNADSNSAQIQWELEQGGNTDSIIMEIDSSGDEYFRTFEDKEWDLGKSSAAWDTVYADDFTNVADFYQFDDRDDLAVLYQIKGSGKHDELTGYELIDDNSLPGWLLKKHKKDGIDWKWKDKEHKEKEIIRTWKRGDVQRDLEGKPYLSLKTMISLLMGTTRQLDDKVESKFRELENRLRKLEHA